MSNNNEQITPNKEISEPKIPQINTPPGLTITYFLFICYLFFFPSSFLIALDFNFRPKGFVSLPLGAGNEAANGSARYSTGGGAELGFEIDLATIWPNPLGLGYTFGLEAGMLMLLL